MLAYEHLEGRGIRSAEVLRAVRQVPRAEFVPEAEKPFAFEDRPLNIGHCATISQPYMVAAMTELLDLEPHHKVLEIGTGSGYQSAVLSRLVREIYSIELIPELAEGASANLKRLGYNNVNVRQGDGYSGWPEAAPFERILLTAAPIEIPQALLDQLAEGGKLVAPEGELQNQSLVVLNKTSDGRIERHTMFPVLFVPMLNG